MNFTWFSTWRVDLVLGTGSSLFSAFVARGVHGHGLEMTSGVFLLLFGVCVLREEYDFPYVLCLVRQWIHVRLPVHGCLKNVHSFST